jgi:hypothetical protein
LPAKKNVRGVIASFGVVAQAVVKHNDPQGVEQLSLVFVDAL